MVEIKDFIIAAARQIRMGPSKPQMSNKVVAIQRPGGGTQLMKVVRGGTRVPAAVLTHAPGTQLLRVVSSPKAALAPVSLLFFHLTVVVTALSSASAPGNYCHPSPP